MAENQSIGIGLPQGYAEGLVFNTFKWLQKVALEPVAQPETTPVLNNAEETAFFEKKVF